MHKISYKARAETFWTGTNAADIVATRLLTLMDAKKTNLSLSLDVTTTAELLRIADALGPEICVLKTHVDILTDFSRETVTELVRLSKLHNFLIFEDRKFADIGNTVAHQYGGGMYKIAEWSHMTNAHPIPGPGIIHGLKQVASQQLAKSQDLLGMPRGLLLLAEMSSQGSLATGEYSQQTVEMAETNRDFVFGFIAGRRLPSKFDFITMSPGVQLEGGKDALGQQYRTPEMVIGECWSDVVIVGRGIYERPDMLSQAKEYRKRCWDAYLKRISQYS